MSEIQHTTLKGELLYLIGRAGAPLSSAELYERCELADEIAKVSKALCNLVSDGKIVRAEGEGRARYTLADGVAAPAPAGKTGRSKAVQADDAARGAPLTGVRQAPEPALPVLDIPTLGAPDHVAGTGKVVEKPVPVRPEPVEGLPGANASRLADAIIARLKTDLGPMLRPYIGESMEAETGATGPSVHIHIEQVDIHLGGL